MNSFLGESRSDLLKELFVWSFGRNRSFDLILRDAGLIAMFFDATRPIVRLGILFCGSIRKVAQRGYCWRLRDSLSVA